MNYNGVQLGRLGQEIHITEETRSTIHESISTTLRDARLPDLMQIHPELFLPLGTRLLTTEDTDTLLIRNTKTGSGFIPGTLNALWTGDVARKQKAQSYYGHFLTTSGAVWSQEGLQTSYDFIVSEYGDYFIHTTWIHTPESEVAFNNQHELGIHLKYIAAFGDLGVYSKERFSISDQEWDMLVSIFASVMTSEQQDSATYLVPPSVKRRRVIEEEEKYRLSTLLNPNIFFGHFKSGEAGVFVDRLLSPHEFSEYLQRLKKIDLMRQQGKEIVVNYPFYREQYEVVFDERYVNDFNPDGSALRIHRIDKEHKSLDRIFLPAAIIDEQGHLVGGTLVDRIFVDSITNPWHDIAWREPFIHCHLINKWCRENGVTL